MIFWVSIAVVLLVAIALLWRYTDSSARGGFTKEQKRQLERMFPPGTRLQGGGPGVVPGSR